MKRNWKSLWKEFSKWLDDSWDWRPWRSQQNKIRELVEKKYRRKLNWRKIWREFNKWFEEKEMQVDTPSWLSQRRNLEKIITKYAKEKSR